MYILNHNTTQHFSVECDGVVLDALTVDSAGQYAAYRIIVDYDAYQRNDIEALKQKAAAWGTKLRYIEAKASFPLLAESEYRR